MDQIITELINIIDSGNKIDNNIINKVISKCLGSKKAQTISKKDLFPYFLRNKNKWRLSIKTQKKLSKYLQIKPRRTASGVATITVMTKPYKCSSACIYCPNNIRVPKSYLPVEPVAQRAEMLFFDPYLQVEARLRNIKAMGHKVEKIELIVLGGTWNDYPKNYQVWFILQMFKALNDNNKKNKVKEKLSIYKKIGIENNQKKIEKNIDYFLKKNNLNNNYNELVKKYYFDSKKFQKVSNFQKGSYYDLINEQRINENSQHRVVGLAIETRPDLINPDNLLNLRKLGCTKIQMGIQSLNQRILKMNNRNISIKQIKNAMSLLRLFGFKIHIHFMLNLFGSTLKKDINDYKKLVSNKYFLPDEIKLYPCALINNTGLIQLYNSKKWKPYTYGELIEILSINLKATPNYMRISRMIRDISANDIVAGNKKSNLRQTVEININNANEIRFREIATDEIIIKNLKLNITKYKTSISNEYFLEWVTDLNKIVGFLRLSLQKKTNMNIPIDEKSAMIREVHVYGIAANINSKNETHQHKGLGKKLIKKAIEISQKNNYKKLYVISAIGTKNYYRSLGFRDSDLYQVKEI